MSEELPFTLHECSDAEELFESLRPRRLSEGRHRSSAIYRGHGNALHQLVPRALRRCLRSLRICWSFELRLLCDFVTACDRAGMPLPGDGAVFRASLDNNSGTVTALRDVRLSAELGSRFKKAGRSAG